MTGKELILATKPFAVEDRGRSWRLMLSTLSLLLAGIAGTIFVEQPVLRLLCSIMTGLFIVRMFVIYHDHQHHAILHRSKLADAIMTAFGIYVLAPTSIWKRSHDYHHSHNSKLFSASIGSYPIASKKKFQSMTAGEKRMYLFIRHPLTVFGGYFTMFIFGMCVSSFASAPRKHVDSLVALILHVVFIVLAVMLGGWQAWFFVMLLPFLIACGLGSYLFYAQHNFPTTSFSDNRDWKYELAAMESSSFMTMGPFMQWVTGNIGYHHIHHLNSRIPFYRLPEVMEALPELKKAKTTSLKPSEIAACFRLKVWDPEQFKMTGING